MSKQKKITVWLVIGALLCFYIFWQIKPASLGPLISDTSVLEVSRLINLPEETPNYKFEEFGQLSAEQTKAVQELFGHYTYRWGAGTFFNHKSIDHVQTIVHIRILDESRPGEESAIAITDGSEIIVEKRIYHMDHTEDLLAKLDKILVP